MAITATVCPACAGISDHREIEHELEPVGAPAHFEKTLLLWFKAAVPPGPHGEKVFEGELSFSCVNVRGDAIWEHAHQGLLPVVQITLVNSQANERGREALGHRSYVVTYSNLIGIKVGIQRQSAVPNDLHTVHGNFALPNKVEHFDER